MMKSGKIIVIEGTDCSGKETQSKLLEKALKKEGKECIRFSFPMYESATGKIVGGSYLGKPEISPSVFKEGPVNVESHVASLYYAADRKYNITEVEKYLSKGYYVILDRYTSSSQAHQGSKIKDPDDRFDMYQWIDKLEYWLLKLPKPDITIFLHVPVNQSLKLMEQRENVDEYEKSEEHLRCAEDAYIELSELYNWSRVECVINNKMRTVEDISKEILSIVKEQSKKTY